MSTGAETKISLEDFYIHFITTHRKERAPDLLSELACQARHLDQPFTSLLAEWMSVNYPQEGFRDDNWYATEIPVEWCYFAHSDFRGAWVPKDKRFVDYLPKQRYAIESASFPCASQICASWTGTMPEPLAQERGPNRYYILDGQLRVIRHWYHKVQNIRVFVYRGERPV